MKTITAIIVGDSRLARNELKELLKPRQHIQLLGESENVEQAFQLIIEMKPDLIFLDINMPEKNGFELLEMLDDVPIVIFTTAYDEYAIKSFEYNAFDYLLKPISKERFAKAIEKVTPHLEGKAKSNSHQLTPESQLFIKDGDNCWIVKLSEISIFEVDGNYTKVFWGNNKPMIYKSLNQIAEKLDESKYFRANRQQIINLDHFKE
ncbi:LytR/AlgR family response regulator transcription factor [Nonlabens antarcticus]|uniref:LytR/AlgR family response regulator transcription factor n=1 Tax=Nonlabens antarcticus TaxID=392714 RepID=UPI00293BB323|nr:response regulator transcription factor [Nonlabens antarcticus]